LNILLLGATLLASWRYASYAKLLKDDTPPEMSRAMERRILVAQGLYGAGVLLCMLSVPLSIGFIFLVQLNYVFAPRFSILYRL
jgi:hypothetical protein